MNHHDEHLNRQIALEFHVLLHSIVLLVWCIIHQPWPPGDYRYILGYLVGLVIFAIGLKTIRHIRKTKGGIS